MTEYILVLENILILLLLLKINRQILKSACNHTVTDNTESMPRVFPRDDETLWAIQEMKKGNKIKE
jgi:hypothetical protein